MRSILAPFFVHLEPCHMSLFVDEHIVSSSFGTFLFDRNLAIVCGGVQNRDADHSRLSLQREDLCNCPLSEMFRSGRKPRMKVHPIAKGFVRIFRLLGRSARRMAVTAQRVAVATNGQIRPSIWLQRCRRTSPNTPLVVPSPHDHRQRRT